MPTVLKYALCALLLVQGLLCAAASESTAKDTAHAIVATAQAVVPPAEVELPPPTFLMKLAADPGRPYVAFLLVALFLLFAYFRSLGRTLRAQLADAGLPMAQRVDLEESLATANGARKASKFFLLALLAGYFVWIATSGTPMRGYLMEWVNLAVRWTHVIAGIMWIGASFYFIFLENNLNRTHGLRDELAGNLWAIHGGGFYYLEKYKVAPAAIPKDLHWFKYEAYFTWLSGFSLLFIVYYADAKAFLIDPSVADISPAAAISIGIGSLLVGWAIYDAMCRSRLILRQDLFALVGTVVLACITYALTHLLSGRAAFIHVGALLGTIMVGNVFFTIIPAQKALVRAARTGRPLDASLGKKAGQRSLHNNYITLPVVFIMISNHFPSTFGHSGSWIILMVIAVASAGIKHYWNLLDRGVKRTWVLVVSLGALVMLSLAISPAMEDTMDATIPTSFREADAVIQRRCIQCHSANPTDDTYRTAPNGVMYDTPQQVHNYAEKIMARAVRTKTMPQGNKTGMTDEERTILKRWILQGAKTD